MVTRSALTRRLALAALMPAAAFAVHQLRFLLAFGGSAGHELQRQGHAYLHSLVPWIALLIALVAGGFLRALGRALAGNTSLPRYTLSLAGLWLACSTALVAIFVAQELLEGVLAAGHPAGLAGIFGYGGWWSIPAALCLGLVVAAIFHGARWALRTVAERCRSHSPRRGNTACRPRWDGGWIPLRLAPLAGGWSGRGPPA
jgi:hypothetical protein